MHTEIDLRATAPSASDQLDTNLVTWVDREGGDVVGAAELVFEIYPRPSGLI